MKEINLRDYYPDYKEDAFIEVPDEVASFLEDEKRRQINYKQYIRDNRAFYSLDCGDGIEAEAVCKPEQPDEAIERRERENLLEMALASLPEIQRRRLYAHVVLQKSKREIAENENVSKASVGESIKRGIANLRKKLKHFF